MTNSILDNPAILNSSDLDKLEELQSEFCSECGKNVILVAYKG